MPERRLGGKREPPEGLPRQVMAKIKLNPVMEAMRGSIGDLVFKRYGEEIVVGRKPDPSEHSPTAGQRAVREQFRLAAVYGKTVMADPATKAVYEVAAKGKGIPVFAPTIADFFNEPTVDEIDLSAYTGHAGEIIRIRAHDDVEVTGVAVAIRGTGGAALEQGVTSAAADGTWTYTATTNLPDGQQVVIEVTATDRPGHKTTKTQAR
jgi:hypothetical protein